MAGWSAACQTGTAGPPFRLAPPNFQIVQDTRWSNLWPGLVLVAVIIVVVLTVLIYGRVGALHGERVHLQILAPGAAGVLSGSEVWLSGRKIGRVESLEVTPPSTDTLARVRIAVEILDEFTPLVRRDADVRVASGGRLLGAPVVLIEGGSARSPQVANGDTLRSRGGGMLITAAERLAIAQDKLPILGQAARGAMSDVRQVTRLTSAAMARLPVERGRAVMAQSTDLGNDIARLMRMGDGTLGARVAQVRARVDSVRAVAGSSAGTLGRFRRDSTLAKQIAGVRDELSALSAAASSPDGTLGRVAADSALQRELGAMSREMAALLADLKRRPLRYLSF